MKTRFHNCPDCKHMTDVCPLCGYSTAPGYGHREHGDIEDWCPNSPVVIAVKADEKRRGVYDPTEWGEP